jgi:hypothetical protein
MLGLGIKWPPRVVFLNELNNLKEPDSARVHFRSKSQ